MTTVVQRSYPQGFPAQQNPAYPPAYPQTGYSLQQAAVIQIPASTTTTTNTTNSSASNKYNKKAGVVTGVLQLVAAGLLVILGIIALILGTFYRSGWNIWGSLCFYMVSGILGVVSKNQNKCVIIAYMVMSILSAVCSGGQVFYDSVAASTYSSVDAFGCGPIDHYYNSYNYHYEENSYCQHPGLLSAMHALAAVTGFCEMIIAIVAASYCCCGMCGTTSPQTTVVTLTQQPAPGATYLAPVSAPYPRQGQYPQAPPPNYAPQQPQAQAPAYEEPK